jgi:SpoVK/Ycf46/Vps4 family AAA+-type ATPase
MAQAVTQTQKAPSFEDQARKLVAAKYSLVFIETHEEERLERLIGNLSKKAFSQPVPFFTWSVSEGLRSEGVEPLAGSDDPLIALDAVVAQPRPALYLFRDLHRFYDDPKLVRKLRDVYRALRPTYKTIFLCSPVQNLPVECHKEISILDLPLPGMEEMDRIFAEVVGAAKGVQVDLGEKHDALIRGTLGLTEEEARQAFSKAILGRRTIGPEIIEVLYEEKRQIVRKEGMLDYIPPRIDLDSIGGLATLKDWLRQRKRFFAREAEEFGLDVPKGVLLTGISGCGKSMAVQAISGYWTLPMLRLDMNRVYSGILGTPERSLDVAIKTAEAVSPCVLWIDEIETAIVGTGGKGGGGASLTTRIFSSFLTWMQEKKHMVFVAATANEIDQLPPELLRKGRFDQIFFVDLPSEAERQEIVAVHLAKRNKDPSSYDLVSLAKATPGFNGAELEQLILSAMFVAFDQKREVTMQDLYRSLSRIVPLSTTMSERIKEIKRWADQRAVKAGG